MLEPTEAGTRLSMPLPKDVALQMVSARTIGSVAAALFVDPPAPGSAIEIATVDVTGEQMASKIAERLNVATNPRNCR